MCIFCQSTSCESGWISITYLLTHTNTTPTRLTHVLHASLSVPLFLSRSLSLRTCDQHQHGIHSNMCSRKSPLDSIPLYCRVLGSTSMINSLFATSDIVEIHLDDYFAPKYQGGWQTQMYVKTDSSNVALTKSENERPYGIFFHFLDGNLNAAQLQAPWFRFPT